MNGANWYRDGTVSIANGSTEVVGVGTLWLVQAKKGDLFAVTDGAVAKIYEINEVIDNTHLDLKTAFTDTTVIDSNYVIIRNFTATRTAEVNAMLTSFLREWDIALRTGMKGDKGDPGDDGATILGGAEAPVAVVGRENDWYIDYTTWTVYRKFGGEWVSRGVIKGEKGDKGDTGGKWFSGSSNPSLSVGVVGDYAINTTTGEIFKRQLDAWAPIGVVKGPKGDTGPLGVVWRGAWSGVVSYAERDLVYQGGSTYIAIAPSTGEIPSTEGSSFWQPLALKGADGTGAGDMTKAVYDPDEDGKVSLAVFADLAGQANRVAWEKVVDVPATFAPSEHSLGVHTAITLAELNTMISDATVPASTDIPPLSAVATTETNGFMSSTDKAKLDGIDLATTSTDGLMSAADKTKLDGLGTGGSSVMLTLVHTTIPSSTTATEYDVLATGRIIGRSDWHMPQLSVLLRRSGSGQVRLSLTDGTTTVTAETAAFTTSGTDELTLDTTTLADGVTWDLSVEALTDASEVTVERLKIMADPVNEFSPVMAVAKAGNSTNSPTFAELDRSYFMAAGINVDAAGGVVALCDVDMGTATEAELRVTVSGAGSSESATATVTASGVTEIRCPYPPVASAVASCCVEGRVTAGSGTISLSHYQLHVER